MRRHRLASPRLASPLLVAAMLLGGLGCAAAPLDAPRTILSRRVCETVVAAYQIGVRPTAIDVEVPPSREGEPASRLMLTGENVPLAEQCLGLPIKQPVAPVAAPPPCPVPPVAPAAPPPVTPRPGRHIDPSLDSRT